MNSDRLDRLESLFRAAQMRSRDERSAYLDAACADDSELRAEVEALLGASEEADAEGFLADGAMPWAAHRAGNDGQIDAVIGQRVGPYQIFRRLGRGGMGDVYQAVRTQPFKQYVALKVIRRGMDTREVVARFEMERQILASLNHPNVARLLDGGVTEDGLPYFALEYVNGRPITRYCDERRLPLQDRLRLFRTVCSAVHYAHQNLVIHRDLKPSNILVTDEGIVKLLDFGIAKLLNPHLSPMELPLTRTTLPMTPEYASPEQVRGDPLTTATDVYALGVILYELLSGHRPYRLAGLAPHEVVSAVCDQQPERPSTRAFRGSKLKHPDGIETVAEEKSISARRGTSPERLQRQIRGDLDNITLTALRKEPERRYGSAEQLGQDVERFLGGLPVVARPNTVGYRARKFVARHRVSMAAVFIVAASLVTGTGVAMWQAAEARRERDRATVAQLAAEEVAGFLERLFAASDPYAPSVVRQDTVRVREFLERGVERIRAELTGQPLVQASMLDVVGRVYRNLGLLDEAGPMLESALETRRQLLGPSHPDVAETLLNTGLLYTSMGDFDSARRVLEGALAINLRALGAESPVVALNQNQLAVVLRKQGHFEEAEQRHQEAIRVLRAHAGEEDPRVAVVLKDLVGTLEEAGDYHAAEQYGLEAVALHRAVYGPSHPQLALALRELGLVQQRLGKHSEAEALFREALAIAEETLGPEHPQVADLLNRLASVRWWQKDLVSADSIHRASLALKRRIYGDVHIEVAYGLNNLASVRRDLGAYDDAEALIREAIAIERATVGEEHPDHWISMANLGTTFWARGDCENGEPILRESIAGLQRTIPRDSLRGPTQWRVLGDCLRILGRYAEAEPLLLRSFDVLSASRGEDDAHTRLTADRLVALYDAWGEPEKAAQYRALAPGEAGR